MFLNNSAKEALIGIANWYDQVNSQGYVTIDDLARLKMFADLSRDILDTNKELSSNPQQRLFNFGEQGGEAEKSDEYYPEVERHIESYLPDDDVPF